MTPDQIVAEANAVCAYSDLAMAIAALPLALILIKTRSAKRYQKRCWVLLFGFFTLSSLLGYFAHEVFVEETANRIVWMFLAPIMYETVNMFVLTAISISGGEGHPNIKQVITAHLISVAGYIPYLLFDCVFTGIESIRILAAFNLAYGTAGFIIVALKAFKPHHGGEKGVLCAFLPLVAACIFQIKRGIMFKLIWYINEDTIAHVCIIVSVTAFFFAARKLLVRADG